ncbi:MAG: DNA-3-methyladenine glycosylase [Clostridiales bacterium]|nr:DNA-3-methyladenine glycosylase [Clostridiales bacterium]
MEKLDRSFYMRDGITVARELIGKRIVSVTDRGVCSGVIVETEAYMGLIDKAAHSCRGVTPRTRVLFEDGGRAYIYLIYGMYCCLNVSVNERGLPECVLIRALRPENGIPLMAARRRTEKLTSLCSGPGKLCIALGLEKEDSGISLLGDRLYLTEGEDNDFSIGTSKRINIGYAEEAVDYEWRFFMKDSKFLSVGERKNK